MQENLMFTDAQLCREIKFGNEAAFQTLFFRYHESLARFLWHRTECVDLSKDIVQEAFIRLWHTREKLQPNNSIKSYLYRIAINLSIDKRRQAVARQRCLSDYSQNHILEFNLPYNAFELTETFDYTLKQLSQKEQITFILSRFEGFKNREIADILEISVKTVESRLAKALLLLRKTMIDSLEIAV